MNREIKFRAWTGSKIVPVKGYDWEESSCNNVNLEDICSVPYSEYKSIMQYTDLKDKNGKEIYEGDVLKYPNGIVEIFWNEQIAAWSFVLINNIIPIDKIEIIGNIYENPELLES